VELGRDFCNDLDEGRGGGGERPVCEPRERDLPQRHADHVQHGDVGVASVDGQHGDEGVPDAGTDEALHDAALVRAPSRRAAAAPVTPVPA
jgi:hypothetical protein